METLYPAGPSGVPAGLTAPSASYRRHAWIAMAGLLAFVAIYFAMLVWLARTAFRLLSSLADPTTADPLIVGITGACAAFLAVFMAKALVFIKRGDAARDLEVTAVEQPKLFEFLYRLADEAGAPRPHRVFLSPRVNAAVFYDLSLANLLLPSRKNLEIGLGLVNVLGLGELKAVLAHEFGHFAQRTMAVGRWVYIAQQVAAHVIAKRDALDAFLAAITRIDLRVAWIGWLLQLIVWSIRALVDLLFRGVVLAQRALSREMEFQADLVAVSLTGSEALVNALHKLGAADDAWDRALRFAADEHARGKPVVDVFALQRRVIEKLRLIHDDPHYGSTPPAPSESRAAYRLFRTELAAPPRMWATHPANADREENAKRVYLACESDPRAAWCLFDDAESLRERVSTGLFGAAPGVVAPLDESLQRLDTSYDRVHLQRRYRGVYLGRAPGRDHPDASALAGSPPGGDLAATLAALYPADLAANVERLRELDDERATLVGLQAGYLKAPGGVVRWRGNEHSPRDLPRLLAQLDEEIAPLREAIARHDRLARAAHLEAARRLGAGWEGYLQGLIAVVHYADHVGADLRDLLGVYDNVVAIVTADDKVSSSELQRVLLAANQMRAALANIHAHAAAVQLDPALAERLGVENWASALGEDGLPSATRENIDSWSRVAHGWVGAATGALGALSRAALEQLLLSERRVAELLDSGEAAIPPGTPSSAPDEYPRLPPGSERKRQLRLDWWSRFQTADGIGATLARIAVAGTVLGSVVFFASSVGNVALSVYNGLAIPVTVAVGDLRATVAPHGTAELSLSEGGSVEVVAIAPDNTEIERFEATIEGRRHHVYNVAGAAALIQWFAGYGSVTTPDDRPLGATRWTATNVDHVFSEPPDQISTESEGGLRSVLTAVSDAPPMAVVRTLSDAMQAEVVRAHARWDGTQSPHLVEWLELAASEDGFDELLGERLVASPRDVVLLRAEQDLTEPGAATRICARHMALAEANPDDGDLRYVAIRCLPDPQARNRAFETAYLSEPDNPWLAFAAGVGSAEQMRWKEAVERLSKAAPSLPSMTDRIALHLVRIERVSEEDLGVDAAALALQSPALAWSLEVEAGDLDAADPRSAFALLARGELDQAIAAAEGSDTLAPMILRLAAASAGATTEIRQHAAALAPTEGMQGATAWYSLALASRDGSDDVEALRAMLDTNNETTSALLGFLDGLASADPEDAESMLDGLAPHSRGIAYAMAVVRLGPRCPERWRSMAQRLLFADERPYLGQA